MKFIDAPSMDRGLGYAEACFETFRVINGQIFAWAAHMHRLATGLAEFDIAMSAGQMHEIREQCLSRAAAAGSDVLMRITVSGGSAEWGLMRRSGQMNLYMQAVPFISTGHRPKSLSLRAWPFPVRSRPAKFVGDYGDTLRALRDMPDADVLFVSKGMLLGAATANVLLYYQGTWWTPEGPGVLPGVLRGHLLDSGLVQSAPCPLAWLNDAESVMLSNCGSFLQPVCDVVSDGQSIGMYDVRHAAISDLMGSLQGLPGLPEPGL
ncbi:MAG TPA: aminotransferase class IV [Mariprofundaceae bacterium]|nr:aminotransferase class IV [Mariprofundaceae bacterium]